MIAPDTLTLYNSLLQINEMSMARIEARTPSMVCYLLYYAGQLSESFQYAKHAQ